MTYDTLQYWRARSERLEAENTRLRDALTKLLEACDRGRIVPKPGYGIGGMTLDANLRASNINGVSAWEVEGARAVLYETPPAIAASSHTAPDGSVMDHKAHVAMDEATARAWRESDGDHRGHVEDKS